MIRHSLHKLVMLLTMFFAILLCHPAASHAAVGDFVFKWGSYGTGDGQFSFPYGIAVSAGGNVYVTDSLNRVQVFTSTGTFITKWGSYGNGDGQFFYPFGIAVDNNPDGNVYVADTNNHRIQVFTSAGAFIRKWGSYSSGDGQFFFPSGVAVDADGNVYVIDLSLSRVQVFTSDGTFIRKWGCYMCGLFSSPYGMAVDASGNVYVADSGNNRIQVFTRDGTFITKWGSYGAGDGQFNFPIGVAVDAGGNVYVADMLNHRIQVFTSTGTFITKWGSYGAGDGQFRNPRGIAATAGGNVYVAEMGNNRVQVFEGLIIDSDGDGIPDDRDTCPHENATGFDANNDGCIDSLSGLIGVVDTLVTEGVISPELKTSLIAKVQNSEASATRENICAAVNELEAFKNQINAQRGRRISNEAADLLTAYADNVIASLLNQLPPGSSC